MNHSFKLPAVGTTIFSKMTALSQEYDAINLAQGFPDFDVDPVMIELVTYFMKANQNQYAPMPGTAQLRKRLSIIAGSLYDFNIDWETEVTITSGATEGLFCAIHTVVNPGDEVIIFEPAYDLYAPAIELAGGILKPIMLEFPAYSIPWDEVVKSISPKTKAIVINSPHNPTGSVLSHADMLVLQELVLKNDIFLIADEAYEHIVFDGNVHQSVLKYPKLWEKSFVVGSLGKTLNATGWRLGFVFAPKRPSSELRKIHQFVTFSCNMPFQLAVAEYMKDESVYKKLSSTFELLRNYFVAELENTAFKPLKTSGSYFMLADYAAISNLNDVQFCEWITKEAKVSAIPVSVFNSNGQDRKVIRFCFGKKQETLQAGLERLKLITPQFSAVNV